MNYLQNIFNETLVNAIGWTILHSIWQGAIVVILATVALSFFKNPSSKLRYNMYASALFGLLSCSLITFCYLHQTASPAVDWAVPVEVQNEQNDIVELVFLEESIASETPTRAETSVSAFFKDLSTMANDYMVWIVALWMLGCMLFSIRFVGGFLYVQRLRKRDVYPVEAHWQKKLDAICRMIGVNKTIRLLESAAVSAPMVIGHFKPVILFPIGALTGLKTSEVEAILAHELAHIYRNDYLVNILQSLAEIVLFYHPAAWWLSSKMQATREHCCDDLAIHLCVDKVVYARALTEIEYLRVRQETPYLAAAFAGNGKEGNLMARIQRLFSPSEKQFNSIDGWVASMMLLIAVLAVSWTSHSHIEAAEKEVNIFIDSVVEDLKWVAEDVNDVFVEMTGDSTKRAKARIKRIEKQIKKGEKSIEKQGKKLQKDKKKTVLKFKNGEGKVVVVPSMPVPPTPPMPPVFVTPKPHILVLPEVPAVPAVPHIPALPEPPAVPAVPSPPSAPNFSGFYDLNSILGGTSDMIALMTDQPDIWVNIAEGGESIFFSDKEGGFPYEIIIGEKDKNKDKNKIKDKYKSKLKTPKRVIQLKFPMGLDSIKRKELQERLKPLKEEIAVRQQKLKESMGDLKNMDESEVERIAEEYEAALDAYEDELDRWEEQIESEMEHKMEQEHAFHFEWNDEEQKAFEGKMEAWAEKWEEWGEQWSEKFSKEWDEDKMEEWAKKWEKWGEEWDEKWDKEWGDKWSKEWEQEYEQKMQQWEQQWEKEWEGQEKEYEFHFKKYEDAMEEYEEQMNLFEDAYEDVMEEREHDLDSDLKDLTSTLREMLEHDGLVNDNIRNIKVRYNRKTIKVNGKEIPANLQEKYNEYFKANLGEDAVFNLSFSDEGNNISLSGKNMEIH